MVGLRKTACWSGPRTPCSSSLPEDTYNTDNSIVPFKGSALDEFYDPLTMLFRKKRSEVNPRQEANEVSSRASCRMISLLFAA
jgi:hypothetical protein